MRRLARWRGIAVRLVFARFFTLLLATVSLAQWVLVVWLLAISGTILPPLAHIIGPVGIYVVNRVMLVSMRDQRLGKGWRSSLLRAYSAIAFTSLFCTLFLGFTTVVWGALRLALGALTAEAGTLQPATGGIDLDGLYQVVSALGCGAIVVAFAYGYTFGQRRLTVTQQRLPVQYPVALDGLRIAQISDIHIGQNLSAAQLRRFVRSVNATDADLVCVTGDIVDSLSAGRAIYLPILGELRARYGVFAVLGNHDHFAGADKVEKALRECTDFTILRDSIGIVELRGSRLHIVGLDDVGKDWARGVHWHPGLERLRSQLPGDEPVLLLTHRPEPFTHAAALGIRLTLAGHTHGGQIAVPWLGGRRRGLARLVTVFDQGLYQSGHCYLYVNRGVGVTGQRIRLFAPREIAVIEVVSSKWAAAA